MTNFFNYKRIAAPVMAVTAILGGSACAGTRGAGSVETPRTGCIPSVQTYTLDKGDYVLYGIADMSHAGDQVMPDTQDYLKVSAEGVIVDAVDEVVFSTKKDSRVEIKRIGKDNTGLPYYEDLKHTHRVDLGAIEKDYTFALREGRREVAVTVTEADELGSVDVTFDQDCKIMPNVG